MGTHAEISPGSGEWERLIFTGCGKWRRFEDTCMKEKSHCHWRQLEEQVPLASSTGCPVLEVCPCGKVYGDFISFCGLRTFHNSFIPSSVDEHLVCLHLLAIVNDAAVDIRVSGVV